MIASGTLDLFDDLQKAENLNCYFAAQMTIYENSYELPTLPRLTYLTDDRLDIVTAKEFHVKYCGHT
jgi:hypothetical protein